MSSLLLAEPADFHVEIPSMCKKSLEKVVGGKKVCSVCGWDEDCDLIIGAVDFEPLTEFLYFTQFTRGEEPEDAKIAAEKIKRAITAMLFALGLGQTEFKIVHKINEDMPEFAPKDWWNVDVNQLVFTPAELMESGIYFAVGDNADPDEAIAFNNLIKHALSTGSIKAILRFNGACPYGFSDDYFWVIIYNQEAQR